MLGTWLIIAYFETSLKIVIWILRSSLVNAPWTPKPLDWFPNAYPLYFYFRYGKS